MGRMGLRAGLMALLMAASGAAWAKGEVKVSKQTEKEVSELTQFRNEFQSAWNSENFQKLGSMYSPDVVSVNAEGRRAIGKNQVLLEQQQELRQGPLQGTQSQFEIQSIRPLAKNMALVNVRQHISGGTQPGTPSEYDIVSVLAKEKGGWKIIDSRVFPSREAAIGGAGRQGIQKKHEMREEEREEMEEECPGMGGAGEHGYQKPDPQPEQVNPENPAFPQ